MGAVCRDLCANKARSTEVSCAEKLSNVIVRTSVLRTQSTSFPLAFQELHFAYQNAINVTISFRSVAFVLSIKDTVETAYHPTNKSWHKESIAIAAHSSDLRKQILIIPSKFHHTPVMN